MQESNAPLKGRIFLRCFRESTPGGAQGRFLRQSPAVPAGARLLRARTRRGPERHLESFPAA